MAALDKTGWSSRSCSGDWWSSRRPTPRRRSLQALVGDAETGTDHRPRRQHQLHPPRQRFLAWRGARGATAREVAEFIAEARPGLTARYARRAAISAIARMLAASWVHRDAARIYLGDAGRAAAVSHSVTAAHRDARVKAHRAAASPRPALAPPQLKTATANDSPAPANNALRTSQRPRRASRPRAAIAARGASPGGRNAARPSSPVPLPRSSGWRIGRRARARIGAGRLRCPLRSLSGRRPGRRGVTIGDDARGCATPAEGVAARCKPRDRSGHGPFLFKTERPPFPDKTWIRRDPSGLRDLRQLHTQP